MKHLETAETEDYVNYLIAKNSCELSTGRNFFKQLSAQESSDIFQSLLEENFDFWNEWDFWIEDLSGLTSMLEQEAANEEFLDRRERARDLIGENK